jgi:nucleoside 2-deoxyribosyltransferase
MSKDGHNWQSYCDIDKHINNVQRVAAWLANHGIHFFAPHLNSAHFEVITPGIQPDFWYALDMRVLSHCDAILLIDNWENSRGACVEKKYCEDNNIPIFYYNDYRDAHIRLLDWAWKFADIEEEQ